MYSCASRTSEKVGLTACARSAGVVVQVAAAVSALRGFAKREPLLRRSRGPEASHERVKVGSRPHTRQWACCAERNACGI